MNILYSVFADGWGGLEKYPLTLYNDLVALGHNVTILTKSNTRLAEEAKKLGIKIYLVDSFKKIDFSVINTMKKIVLDNKIDVVHMNTSRELYNWRIALLGNTKVKLVLTFHIGVPNHNELLHRLLYKRVDKILAISKVEMEEMYTKLPVPKDKISLLYNGVNLSKFKRENIEFKGIREKFSIPGTDTLFISIGNLSKGKGILDWLEATKKICTTRKNASFIWIGDDSHVTEDYSLSSLREDIKNFGLENRIILAGYQTDVPSFLIEGDIFLLPSWNESFGIVYIEAMAMGLPAIACNSGGAREVVQDGINGYLCEPKNVESLIDTINKALDTLPLLKKIGDNNTKYVEQFSMKIHITKLLNIYNS